MSFVMFEIVIDLCCITQMSLKNMRLQGECASRSETSFRVSLKHVVIYLYNNRFVSLDSSSIRRFIETEFMNSGFQFQASLVANLRHQNRVIYLSWLSGWACQLIPTP